MNHKVRNAKLYELNGRMQTIVEWAKEYGVPAQRTRARLSCGWTLEDALTKGRQKKSKCRKEDL